MNTTGIEQAIKAAGSQEALGRLLGVRQSLVSYWKLRRIPAEWVLRIEAATGVSRHDLRPDIYPREEVA